MHWSSGLSVNSEMTSDLRYVDLARRTARRANAGCGLLRESELVLVARHRTDYPPRLCLGIMVSDASINLTSTASIVCSAQGSRMAL
jgi:hypothetical protein